MTAPALDPEVVAQLRADLAPEDLRQVCLLMEEDARVTLGVLATAARAGDAGGWARAAHRLAGGAGGVGALRLEALARQAMQEGLAMVATRLPEIAAEVQRVMGAMRDLAGSDA